MVLKNDDIYDALTEVINSTVEHFLGGDPYYPIAPYLCSGEIDSTCPFFDDNRITLSEKGLSSDELKTISHLSTFYRNRVAYNPVNIDRYLQVLGHITYSQSSMDILCFHQSSCGDVEGAITYEEWKNLPYPEFAFGSVHYSLLIDTEVQTTIESSE